MKYQPGLCPFRRRSDLFTPLEVNILAFLLATRSMKSNALAPAVPQFVIP